MKLLKLIFGRLTWQKVVVEVHTEDTDMFVQAALDITDLLWERALAPMYFARYSGPNTPCRVEIKVELGWSKDKYQDLFENIYPWTRVVSVEPVEGSREHAYAYLLSRELRGKGEPLMRDTMHWLFNMSGYSYPQEIRMLCETSAVLIKNMEHM
jgi:hypothetical protein